MKGKKVPLTEENKALLYGMVPEVLNLFGFASFVDDRRLIDFASDVFANAKAVLGCKDDEWFSMLRTVAEEAVEHLKETCNVLIDSAVDDSTAEENAGV